MKIPKCPILEDILIKNIGKCKIEKNFDTELQIEEIVINFLLKKKMVIRLCYYYDDKSCWLDFYEGESHYSFKIIPE